MSVVSVRNGMVLAGLLALWWTSIIAVVFPSLWAAQPTFPPSPSAERIYFFLGSAIAAAVYSMYLGLKCLRSAP